MPRTIACQFGIINVSSNRMVIEMAKNTKTSIKFVPYIVMYINGAPVMSYNGPPDEEAIRTFILTVSESNKAKQQFVAPPDTTQQGATPPEPVSNIPEFTIGRPKNIEQRHVKWSAAYSP